ncbi:class I SAM-dependent RNA methyltransferase [Thalassobius sp. Cn5-15]|uniref:class I SAM-dependent RNA methyltransferase n=1 Tax=Thalassobius sp. Cn5-15 TaxID=2917763 RepID=UPI001EF1FA27|nr:class I SAM-dependent RNA methyltransferase [Thalassobius sp. Cn5-15]MCG7493979.1 class I SAM-dependent RNA methyltransferase [Thalassobius sp. Cn5-15]
MQTYQITRLGHQGDGIVQSDEGAIFAPMTLPGEEVRGRIDGQKLCDIRIATPSDHRVSPDCRHYKSCGGCQLQHASDGFVADWKLGVVQQALSAQGLEAPLRPILTSPPQTRRRASLSVRRTKKGAMAGFHAKGSDVIVEVPDCQLLHPEVMKAMPVAEKLATIGGSRKGELSVLATMSLTGLDLAVSGGKPLDEALRIALSAEVEAYKLARLSWDGEVIGQREPPLQQFGAAQVAPPAGAFLQATPEGEQDLLTTVQEIVGKAKQVIDLFAGCGTFALPLAKTAEVHAVEGEKAMMAALDRGWRQAQGLKKVSHEARDLFRRPLMPDELRKTDAVVIDPPRAGAEAQVRELAQSDVPVIAFVSCNPVTFARDARILTDGPYQLDWVQVVDQFRWSSHVELVAKFSRMA